MRRELLKRTNIAPDCNLWVAGSSKYPLKHILSSLPHQFIHFDLRLFSHLLTNFFGTCCEHNLGSILCIRRWNSSFHRILNKWITCVTNKPYKYSISCMESNWFRTLTKINFLPNIIKKQNEPCLNISKIFAAFCPHPIWKPSLLPSCSDLEE